MLSTTWSESDTEQNFKLSGIEETDYFCLWLSVLWGFLNLLQPFQTFNITKLEGIFNKKKKKSKTKTLTVLGAFPEDTAPGWSLKAKKEELHSYYAKGQYFHSFISATIHNRSVLLMNCSKMAEGLDLEDTIEVQTSQSQLASHERS